MKKICFILGTRPEIIKLSPVIGECQKQGIPFFIIHSNQHYSDNMDKSFFEELGLPKAKYNLNVRESLHGKMVGKMLEAIEAILIKEKPSIIVVQGDTNTTLAGGLAAAKLQIKVAHVEAGLRSYDRSMPEETNRVLVDHLAEFLFCPTQKQAGILKDEGIENAKIIVTGNTIVDAVEQNLSRAESESKYSHYKDDKFILLTLHRPSNVDNPERLTNLLGTIADLSKDLNIRVIFPVHPRTSQKISLAGFKVDPEFIRIIEPVMYLEMLMLEKHAQLVLTDSGGVQEETCILKTPCVTLRQNTERPETIAVGANILAGTERNKILSAANKIIKINRNWKNPFGDGRSSQKIVELLTS